MTSPHQLKLAVWLGLVYVAAVVQTAWGPEPHWLLAVAAGWLTTQPGARGVLGVAAIGGVLDAVGSGRLGLHLGTCGVLAAVAAMSLGTLSRGWQRPLVAAWLTFGNGVVSALVLSLSTSSPLPTAALREAAVSAAYTAGLIAGVALLWTIIRRCLHNSVGVPTVRLGNRWHRLTT
jgi:hypothetical protein